MSNEQPLKPGGTTFGDNAQNNVVVERVYGNFVYNAAAQPKPPPPHQLRKPLDDFTGRKRYVAELLDLMRRKKSASIVGMPGIGKTELALIIAAEISKDYSDSQLMLDMRGADEKPLTTNEALASCIRGFEGVDLSLSDDCNELNRRYLSLLSGKKVLVLLDNVADFNQVQMLRPPAGCAFLVTSRNVIAGIDRVTLDQLSLEEARELLVRICHRIRPEEADQISELCGYLPLALRAAGSLLDVTVDLDVADYVAELADERTRIEAIGTEGVEIGVEASFNLSYNRLAAKAAQVFRGISVFRGSFDAATEVIVCEDVGNRFLRDLVKRSLVQYEEKTKLHRLHDLVRLFADSKMIDTERETVRSRHAELYQTVLAAANDFYLKGHENIATGLELFDQSRANIEAGQAWAIANVGKDGMATNLCISYPANGANVLQLRQHPRQLIQSYEAMLIAVRNSQSREAEGIALNNLSNAYWNLGETRRAIEFYEQSLPIKRETGDRRGEGQTLGNLGLAYMNLGEIRRAIEFFQQYLAIARETRDRRDEGTALNYLGIAYKNLGEARRAIELYEQSLPSAREIGDRILEGQTLSGLGVAYTNLGDNKHAIVFLEQYLAIARETGDRRSEGQTLGNLGNAYVNLGETRRAIRAYEQWLTIARETGDRKGEGTSLRNLGAAYISLGDPQRAIEFCEQSLPIVLETGDRIGEGQVLNNFGVVYWCLGDARRAIGFYEQVLVIARETEDRRGEGDALWNIALALDELRDRPQAIAKAEAALVIFEQIENPSEAKVREYLKEWRGK